MSKFTRSMLVLAALTAAVACDPDQLAGGGIGGSGITRGPITGFGSVFVNGIEWDTNETEIEFEGRRGIQDDLEIGMIVVIEGDFSRDGSRGVARSLRYDDELEGPITTIDSRVGGELVKWLHILGKKVVVERGVARFDDDDPSFTFESIARDDVVKVSGYVDESGTIIATYIERTGKKTPGSTEVEVKGVIREVADDGSFKLGSIAVYLDPDGVPTDLSELPGGVRDDIVVEVEGLLRSDGGVDARKIELEDELGDGDDLQKLNLEGIVSDFDGLDDFRVADQRVNAMEAEFEMGAEWQVADGVRVKVEGPRVRGVLRAKKVEVRADELRVQAAVARQADVNAKAGTLRLLGIKVTVNAGTIMSDDRDDLDRFTLADIEAGDSLEVRGITDGASGIVATLVERNDEKEIALRGLVEAEDDLAGTVTILGVTIQTHERNTKFEGENDQEIRSDEFFSAVEIGDLVSVKDEDDGDPTAIDIADEIEIERTAPRVSAGLAWLPLELLEAAATAEDEIESGEQAPADEGGTDGEAPDGGARMVRTVHLYFATAEARAREAHERNTTGESQDAPLP